MSHRTALIAGAGIAGPALAYWLHRHDMPATVVERAPGLRAGGQTVDLRGAGRAVARRMGLEAAVRAASTGEAGIRFVDGRGRTRAALPADAFGGQGPVTELEILRGELCRLLHEATREHTAYVFGDEITHLRDDGDRVHVTFRHAADRAFDLLIAADGAGSRTRDLVFGDTTRTRHLGLCTAYLTIPREPRDGRWARWHNATRGRTVTLRPDNQGTTRAHLSFLSPDHGYERLEPAAQVRLLRRVFADVGGEAPRVLAALDSAPDLYVESVAQVLMPRWSHGRVGVLGDAAHCASPLSGMGTSLAFTGAYVLAGELARHAHHRDAFAAYESALRPYVERAQKLPPGVPRIATPRTRAGIRTLNTVLRAAGHPRVSRALGRFLVPPADTFPLPAYGV
ncbi:FAD-dependent monooxygenase [Streptomyces pinistramenti]|uniref:FAD-dependent monooxygenase n=1 Tax=Streptomyces pinistramenti TaxID=2884812 RepID=UPI001D08C750|nr:FAD-dependent monooxygenase [Streptomyces pinistramenti]MCB5908338.1 FAD-dependent monooxygenase [Streptomyces pinistramenti]